MPQGNDLVRAGSGPVRAPGLSTALSAALLLLLLAPLALLGVMATGCASDGGAAPRSEGDGAAVPSSPFSDPAAEPDRPAAAPAGGGIMAGWVDLRDTGRVGGRLTTLTLVSETREEGRLMASGRAVMDGGKVVSARTAEAIVAAFEEAGFNRFSIQARPTDGPTGAMQAVWLDRGRGVETLFLLPGARQDPRTADLPDVFQAVKYLVFKVHQETPGSMVTTGEGWTGDDMMNQKPERRR